MLTLYLAFPRVITESERREVQKLPFIGTKVSNLVGRPAIRFVYVCSLGVD